VVGVTDPDDLFDQLDAAEAVTSDDRDTIESSVDQPEADALRRDAGSDQVKAERTTTDASTNRDTGGRVSVDDGVIRYFDLAVAWAAQGDTASVPVRLGESDRCRAVSPVKPNPSDWSRSNSPRRRLPYPFLRR
jgi:hypothetical protein